MERLESHDVSGWRVEEAKVDLDVEGKSHEWVFK